MDCPLTVIISLRHTGLCPLKLFDHFRSPESDSYSCKNQYTEKCEILSAGKIFILNSSHVGAESRQILRHQSLVFWRISQRCSEFCSVHFQVFLSHAHLYLFCTFRYSRIKTCCTCFLTHECIAFYPELFCIFFWRARVCSHSFAYVAQLLHVPLLCPPSEGVTYLKHRTVGLDQQRTAR